MKHLCRQMLNRSPRVARSANFFGLRCAAMVFDREKMPRETYSALTACLFLCCSLDLCEVRHIAALSMMVCLLSYMMAMQELNTWKEIAKFLAWASGLFSVSGVPFRSADSEESYELPNPLPFLEWYSFSPAPCPIAGQNAAPRSAIRRT